LITWQQIHDSTHSFSAGIVDIAIAFSANTLAIECSTKPEYALTRQIVGYIYQSFGNAQKGYALYSGKDILILSLPETDRLIFVPTSYLSDNYTLSIAATTIGSVSSENTAPIPDLILGLSPRVSALEDGFETVDNTLSTQAIAIEALQNSISNPSWDDITGKPSSFTPSSHNHAIGQITNLAEFLSTYALKNEIPSLLVVNQNISSLQTSDTGQNTAIGALQTNVSNLSTTVSNLGSSSASLAYTLLSTNQALESNKKYLASVTGLVCSLPSSPAIGDVVSLSTGNFDLRINHDNASRRIVNLSTLTTIGASNGIILKPYADIDLVFMGGNLWKTGYRNRTINNVEPQIIGALALISVALSTNSGPASFNTTLQSMQDGVRAPNNSLASGYLADRNFLNLLITASSPFILDQVRLWNGQSNLGLNAASSYWTSGVTVYRGNSISGVNLGSFTFTNNTGIEQIRNIISTLSSTEYFLTFTANQASIGIMELEFHGRPSSGGEIIAV